MGRVHAGDLGGSGGGGTTELIIYGFVIAIAIIFCLSMRIQRGK